jgi:hypothetical protein
MVDRAPLTMSDTSDFDRLGTRTNIALARHFSPMRFRLRQRRAGKSGTAQPRAGGGLSTQSRHSFTSTSITQAGGNGER